MTFPFVILSETKDLDTDSSPAAQDDGGEILRSLRSLSMTLLTRHSERSEESKTDPSLTPFAQDDGGGNAQDDGGGSAQDK